jgi:hypothetical protein
MLWQNGWRYDRFWNQIFYPPIDIELARALFYGNFPQTGILHNLELAGSLINCPTDNGRAGGSPPPQKKIPDRYMGIK